MDDDPLGGVLDGEAPGVSRTILGELPQFPEHKNRVGKDSRVDKLEAMHLQAIRSNVHESLVPGSEYPALTCTKFDLGLYGSEDRMSMCYGETSLRWTYMPAANAASTIAIMNRNKGAIFNNDVML